MNILYFHGVAAFFAIAYAQCLTPPISRGETEANAYNALSRYNRPSFRPLQFDTTIICVVDGWHSWNERFGDTLYHQTGVTMLTRREMAPGGFEHESYTRLLRRGHRPERLDAGDVARRFPAWNAEAYVDGFYNPRAGFAESGRVVETLIRQARELGVGVHQGQTAAELVTERGAVTAVLTREGETWPAGGVVVCAGAWTPWLVPELRPVMRATGHPVFHLAPADPELFAAPGFVVFTADVANSGWYGFPLHPRGPLAVSPMVAGKWRTDGRRDPLMTQTRPGGLPPGLIILPLPGHRRHV